MNVKQVTVRKFAEDQKLVDGSGKANIPAATSVLNFLVQKGVAKNVGKEPRPLKEDGKPMVGKMATIFEVPDGKFEVTF